MCPRRLDQFDDQFVLFPLKLLEQVCPQYRALVSNVTVRCMHFAHDAKDRTKYIRQMLEIRSLEEK